MSRAATATPPPPYFPHRTTTPTMRHGSSPNLTNAHFTARLPQHQPSRRKVKVLPPSLGALSPKVKPSQARPTHAEHGPLSAQVSTDQIQSVAELDRRIDCTASWPSIASLATSASSESLRLESEIAQSGADGENAAVHSILSPENSMTDSFATPSLRTPSSTSVTLQQDAPIASDLILGGDVRAPIPTVIATPASPARSWVPNFGRMAKAVVIGSMTIGIPFSEKKGRKDIQSPKPRSDPPLNPVAAEYMPEARYTSPPEEVLTGLSPEERQAKEREWTEAEHRRITECARLCSQFPQSGYNLNKWGPNGARHYYEPQCSANPAHVKAIMQKQAELELQMRDMTLTYYPAHRSRDSDSDTEPSIADSSLPSPTTSMFLSADDALATATAANIKAGMSAAMSSPLISALNGAGSSQVSLLLSPDLRSIKGARTLSELDGLASSMALSREDAMDVDSDTASLLVLPDEARRVLSPTRPARAQSCGAKRPLLAQDEEEEKRRKVDEAMVLEDAIDTGVIMPAMTRVSRSDNRMSVSTPDLSQATSQPAMFGHVVKTSDTHPIIISPFFPSEMLPILTEHLVHPPSAGPWSSTPLLLGSDIDVPSLLLSYVPKQQTNGAFDAYPALVPSPVQSSFSGRWPRQRQVGNLLLSSCPGKRLRMEGPIKGRGPVCRDLTTDLRRIKSEGVGCIVCCLDDVELELLGVPWETYRDVAAETGLDIIRLPMPDGFTPVSLSLFDSQVTLIATRYSLQGTNVLIHCRGGVGRAGLTACAWAIKMGYVQPHPSLAIVEEAALSQARKGQNAASSSSSSGSAPAPVTAIPAELEHQIIMSIVERVIAMIRSRRGLKAIESFEQVQFLASYVRWLRASVRAGE